MQQLSAPFGTSADLYLFPEAPPFHPLQELHPVAPFLLLLSFLLQTQIPGWQQEQSSTPPLLKPWWICEAPPKLWRHPWCNLRSENLNQH